MTYYILINDKQIKQLIHSRILCMDNNTLAMACVKCVVVTKCQAITQTSAHIKLSGLFEIC